MWVWNREYVAHNFTGDERWLLVAGVLIRLSPWVLVHLVAVPLACGELWRGGEARSSKVLLLSALYLGWLFQAVVLQHLFDYVHVPALLLGLTLVCRHAARVAGSVRTLVLALLVLAVAIRLPGLTGQRLGLWDRCLHEGSSVELRDRLSLLPRMSWTDRDRVRVFLEEQQTGDGELTCYNMRTVSLHLALGRRPATRNFLLGNILPVFRRQRERVWDDLAASRQRFLVFDAEITPWKDGDGEGPPRDRLVFRAGRYAVYAVDGPSTRAWIEAHVEL
jgi:hypothetical protein